MSSKFGIWWREHWVVVIIITFFLAIGIGIFLGYWLKLGWTGFDEHVGPNVQQYQPAKTLWDWLQLAIVPLVIAGVGLWFTQVQKNNEQTIASDNQRETALQAYIDKMSELLLKEHLSELLPDGKADQKYRQQQNGHIKDELKPEYEAVRKVARGQTLTILLRLDAIRKGRVVQFLHESGLIDKNKRIIHLNAAILSRADLSLSYLIDADLSRTRLSNAILSKSLLSGADFSGADLSGADLSGAYLSRDSRLELEAATLSGAILSGAKLSKTILRGVDLSGAILSEADLRGADLRGADLNLSGAYLSEANLSGADLSDANLQGAANITTERLEKQAKSLQGTIMPDGSKHA